MSDNPNSGIDYRELVLAIGKKIREARIHLGYTQEDLAVKTGFHRTYIGMVERGEQNITMNSCCKLVNALELKIEDLLCYAKGDCRS